MAKKKDPVADFEGVRDERIRYWRSLLKGHTEKTYTFRDEEGNEKSVDLKAKASDLETVAKQLGNAEAINLYYDNRTRELREQAIDSATSKLERETEEALHKYLEKAAKQLDHSELVGRSMEDLYGTLLQIGAQSEFGEEQVKKLLHYAQKNTKKGRESRVALIGLISSHARQNKIRKSNLYHTRHIRETDLDKITAYKHAAAVGAHLATHGHYKPNIDNVLTLDQARGLVNRVPEYVMHPESPHMKEPTQSAFYTKSKKKKKNIAA